MKKYLIKKHCEATEMLTIANDRIQDYYYGNNQDGTYLSRNHLPTKGLIEEFGYNSIEDAKKRFVEMCKKAEFEQKHGMWDIKVEIVEVN